MDRLDTYILPILEHYQTRAVLDGCETRLIATTTDYLLVRMGWHTQRRVYEIVIHLVIRDGKVWLECDNSYDILTQLVEAGIPRDQIVLGDQEEWHRQYTDFAVR